jgi:hypothetical protein
MQNKKAIVIVVLVALLLFVFSAYLLLGSSSLNSNEKPGESQTPVVEVPENNDIYIRDENGEIKNVLVIETEDYRMNMDLLGTWKEYLLPIDERDKYQAFMIPDKTSDAIPYFYILIEKSPVITSSTVIEEEIMYSLRSEYDSFELEQLSKKTSGDSTKYHATYKIIKDKSEYKNYLTIKYKDGYKISFIYSALSIAYANEKGYIDDMINTAEFTVKESAESK